MSDKMTLDKIMDNFLYAVTHGVDISPCTKEHKKYYKQQIKQWVLENVVIDFKEVMFIINNCREGKLDNEEVAQALTKSNPIKLK